MKRIKVGKGRVAAVEQEKAKTTPGGLYIPQERETGAGVVYADIIDANCDEYTVRDVIVFEKLLASKATIEGKTIYVVKEEDILGKVL